MNARERGRAHERRAKKYVQANNARKAAAHFARAMSYFGTKPSLVGFVVSFVYEDKEELKVYFASERRPMRIFSLGDEARFCEAQKAQWITDDSNVSALRQARKCEFAPAKKGTTHPDYGDLEKYGIKETLLVTEDATRAEFVILTPGVRDEIDSPILVDLWRKIRFMKRTVRSDIDPELADFFQNTKEHDEYKMNITLNENSRVRAVVFAKSVGKGGTTLTASLVYAVDDREEIKAKLLASSDMFIAAINVLAEKKRGFGESEAMVMARMFKDFCLADTTKCHGGLLPCWLLLFVAWGFITAEKRQKLVHAIERDRKTAKKEDAIMVEYIMEVLEDTLAKKTPLKVEMVASRKCAQSDL
jgi:hypothetical protein